MKNPILRVLVIFFFLLVGSEARADFSGQFAVGNWINGSQVFGCGAATVDTSNAPASVTLAVPTNCASIAAAFTYPSASSGKVTFSYSYTLNPPLQASQVQASYFVNGVAIQFSSNSGGPTQTGTVSFDTAAGKNFGFLLQKLGSGGIARLVISNFQFAPAVPQVSCSSATELNTGTNRMGDILADNATDLGWQAAMTTGMTTPPNATGLPPASAAYTSAIVGKQDGSYFTAPASFGAQWISREGPSTSFTPDGDWFYRIRFALDPAADPTTFSLSGTLFADNNVAQVFVNGVAQSGNTSGLPQAGNNDPYQFQGFNNPATASNVTLNKNWQAGTNELIVQVKSGQPKEGFLGYWSPSCPAPKPSVSVTKTAGVSSATPGQIVNYTVKIANTGTVAANGTTVSDVVPSGVTAFSTTCAATGGAVCPNGAGPRSGPLSETIATLPASGVVTYTIAATVASNPPDPVVNSVSVSPPAGGLCSPGNTAPPCTAIRSLPRTPQPDLGISLGGLPTSVMAGSAYTGTFTCTNSGNADATAGTSCSVSGLPTGITQGACTISPSGAAWTAGAPVPVSQTVTCSVSGTPSTSGTATVTGSTGATGDNNTASTTINVSPAAPSATDVLTSVQPPPSAAAGSTVTVPIRFANVGAATVLVSYSLQLPTGLTGIACTGSGVTCSYVPASGVVTLSGLPASLASGQSVPFSLNYIAPAAGTPVPVTSTVSTTASEANTSNNTATGTTTTLGAGGKPDVVASVAAPTTTTPGGAVSVPVTFNNVGDVTAGGVSYMLTLPASLGGVSCAAPVTCTYDGGTGATSIAGLPATLAPGATTGLTLSYTAPAAGVVPTTATIATTTAGETNTGNNSATGNTTVVAGSGSGSGANADASVTLSPPATAAPGATVSVPVTVANAGPQAAAGLSYTLNLPASLSGVACSGSSVTCSYDPGTGVVTVSGLPTTLTANQSIPFTLSYTAPASGQVPISAGIATGTNDPNSGNNTASATTAVGVADVATTVSAPASVVAGSSVSVPVAFSNAGTVSAAGVGYQLTLTGLSGGASVSNNGVACSYSGGAVTGCGLPTSLAPGQTVNLSVSFTAPATGPVGIASTISTTSAETNTGNNTNSGSTAVTAAPAPDLGINLAGLPTAATIGSPYSGTFSCTNGGNADATAGTSCSVSGLPAGVTAGACTISPSGAVFVAGSPIAAGRTVTCSVSGTPTAAGASQVTGSTGATGDSNPGNNTATTSVTVSAPVPADVLATVTAPPSVTAGGSVSVGVTFANAGAASAAITGYTLQLSPGLANVSCSGAGAGCAYDSATGTITLTGLPSTLAANQSVAFSLSFTAPAAGAVTVAASIATSTTEVNTANNSASGTTAVLGGGTKPDVLAMVDAPTTVAAGSPVRVPVRFGNVGDAPAGGVSYGLTLPPGLAGVSCTAPVVCSYDGATGVVTVTGLPPTLAAGTFVNLSLNFTAPASGVISTAAAISTTTPGETNVANNSATGQSTVVPATAGADVSVTLAPPANGTAGTAVNVPITVANAGPATATGISYTVSLPPGLSGVSCAPAGVSCSYASGTGVVTVTGLPTSLAGGQSVPFTLSYTAPASGQVPVNAAIMTTSSDPNSGNNAASGTTLVVPASGAADLTSSVSPPASAAAGSVVRVPVSIGNAGTAPADSVSLRITFSGAPTGVTVTNGGAACNVDSTTGVVSGCDLPATLSAGQRIDLVVDYTAPAGGQVGITASVSTSSVDSNPGNNTASGSTTLTAVPPTGAPDLGINLDGLPATGTVGVAYSGSFSCSNSGTAGATSATTCSVSGLPAGLTVVACTIGPAAAPWVAGNPVPASSTVTCTVRGTPTAPGGSTITGSTSAGGDANPGNNTASREVTVSAAAPPAAVQPIPSLSEWASIVLSGLIALIGSARLRRREKRVC